MSDYTYNPGSLNKKVTLLKPVSLVDAFGSPYIAWHPVADVSASIEPLRGREFWEAAQVQAEATVRITIRYMKGITSEMRILYLFDEKKSVYELRGLPIDANEGHTFLQLMCREVEGLE